MCITKTDHLVINFSVIISGKRQNVTGYKTILYSSVKISCRTNYDYEIYNWMQFAFEDVFTDWANFRFIKRNKIM